MWQGFGTEADAQETERRYFRPRISSISGVLAMTKRHFFSPPTPSAVKDDIETQTYSQGSGQTSYPVNPSASDSLAYDNRLNGTCLTGATRFPSPSRASYGDVMAFSRPASGRPSIDSTTAHAVYGSELNAGDHLTSQEQNDAEAGENVKRKCSDRTKKSVLGFAFTIIIAACWVCTLHLLKICFNLKQDPFLEIPSTPSTLNETIESTPTAGQDLSAESQKIFDAPFFVTWFFGVWNILFLPIYILSHLFNCTKNEKTSLRKSLIESLQQLVDRGLTLLQFMYRCGFFCFLWMISNYMLMYSIRVLDATVVMSIFSCTIPNAYMLSWVVLHQRFVGVRIVAVIICFTGIALLAYMDGVQKKILASVMITLCSAIGSAVYKVFFRRMIGYTTFAQMSVFFSLIALLNALFMWPMVFFLYFVGAETIVWSRIPWLYLTSASGLLFLANVIGNYGVLWTYEVFLSIGLFFAIPVSAVIDVTVYHVIFRDMKLAGVILILIGFLVVLLPADWNECLGNILRTRIAKFKRKDRKKNGRVQDTSTGQLSRLRTPSGRVK